MATITLRKVPDELHRLIKREQLDREDKGERISLEELYIELIEDAVKAKRSNEKK